MNKLSPLTESLDILHLVRHPEGVYLKDIAYEPGNDEAVGTFQCPRSKQFPNPEIGELTGGQIFDSIAQMAYCLAGLMIRDGVDLLGLDFDGFKKRIHAHKVHLMRSEVSFLRPSHFDRPFDIHARIERFPSGDSSTVQENPRRYLHKIAFDGTQRSDDDQQTASDTFRARIAVCYQLSQDF